MLVRSVLVFVAAALTTVGANGATKLPVRDCQGVLVRHVPARTCQSFDYSVAPSARSWPGASLLNDPSFIAPNGGR
jgi:hypothetical protein